MTYDIEDSFVTERGLVVSAPVPRTKLPEIGQPLTFKGEQYKIKDVQYMRECFGEYPMKFALMLLEPF